MQNEQKSSQRKPINRNLAIISSCFLNLNATSFHHKRPTWPIHSGNVLQFHFKAPSYHVKASLVVVSYIHSYGNSYLRSKNLQEYFTAKQLKWMEHSSGVWTVLCVFVFVSPCRIRYTNKSVVSNMYSESSMFRLHWRERSIAARRVCTCLLWHESCCLCRCVCVCVFEQFWQLKLTITLNSFTPFIPFKIRMLFMSVLNNDNDYVVCWWFQTPRPSTRSLIRIQEAETHTHTHSFTHSTVVRWHAQITYWFW